MLTEAIKKYRDLAKGKCKIQIIGDNGQIFYDGIKDNVCLWLDDQEILMIARPNNATNQAAANFEITMLDYDHIQYMKLFCNDDVLKETLEATGHPNQQKAFEMLSKSDVVNANITGATGDGIDYGHIKPNIMSNGSSVIDAATAEQIAASKEEAEENN